MSTTITGTAAASDFELDVTIVEGADPVAALLRSTDDGCGSTCSGTACTSFGGNV
ncbi:FxLD family lanthipeptide [Kitasatospora sp. YST-16]|uniref:FxLD family lanthipeptide n=1 Tax=Kitasatospora sp. YST-16 TaxID=2998080 RepID=UPI002283F181|nr:FxLD family lanthipeptide [Kitasatospora sp. YST-16]WAL70505.1 FxLD family lanthipeptide [Kitasatospora sp. YST-16]WNW36545.1 FxLD family lanthipeptide [Streptomyces sp. Li-HN-5-13]